MAMPGTAAVSSVPAADGDRPDGGGRTSGGYTGIKWWRFTMVVLALLDAAAHLFASPGQTPEVTFWLETEVATYILIATVYLLGLRIWYSPAIAYSVLNVVIFFLSALVPIPGITQSALVGHIQFAHYSFGRGFSLLAWVYLIAVGFVLNRRDHGSSLNALLRQDS